MKLKFPNGIVKKCPSVTEQKLFKTNDGKSECVGWLLTVRLTGHITSSELDEFFTEDNINTLNFSTDEDKPLFVVNGYTHIISSTIRNSDATETSYTEVQLKKGV